MKVTESYWVGLWQTGEPHLAYEEDANIQLWGCQIVLKKLKPKLVTEICF